MRSNHQMRGNQIRDRLRTILIAIIVGVLLGALGCASKKTTPNREEAPSFESQIASLRLEVTDTKNRVNTLEEKVTTAEMDVTRLKRVAVTQEEALQRAAAAGDIEKPKLLYEVTLSEDAIRFALEESRLSRQAKGALDIFADDLIAKNNGCYIEIQGHTDNTGSRKYNMRLGTKRAETVMRYLHVRHGIPLHRMSTISYGETRPVAPNDTEENRVKNRRVVLLVME